MSSSVDSEEISTTIGDFYECLNDRLRAAIELGDGVLPESTQRLNERSAKFEADVASIVDKLQSLVKAADRANELKEIGVRQDFLLAGIVQQTSDRHPDDVILRQRALLCRKRATEHDSASMPEDMTRMVNGRFVFVLLQDPVVDVAAPSSSGMLTPIGTSRPVTLLSHTQLPSAKRSDAVVEVASNCSVDTGTTSTSKKRHRFRSYLCMSNHEEV